MKPRLAEERKVLYIVIANKTLRALDILVIVLRFCPILYCSSSNLTASLYISIATFSASVRVVCKNHTFSARV